MRRAGNSSHAGNDLHAENDLHLFVLVTRERVCTLADAGAKADAGNGSHAGAFALFSVLIAREIAHLVRGGRAL